MMFRWPSFASAFRTGAERPVRRERIGFVAAGGRPRPQRQAVETPDTVAWLPADSPVTATALGIDRAPGRLHRRGQLGDYCGTAGEQHHQTTRIAEAPLG